MKDIRSGLAECPRPPSGGLPCVGCWSTVGSVSTPVHLPAHLPVPRPWARGDAHLHRLVPVVVDAAVVAAVGAVSLALLAHGGLGVPSPRARPLDLTRTLLAAATAVPLLGWRRWPLAAFVAVAVASVILAARGEVIWPPVGLAAAVYLLVRGRPEGTPWARARLAVVAVLLGTYLGFSFGHVGELIHSGVALAAAWFAGEVSRLRRAQLAELRDRAARLERDAARERDLAVAEERTRISRDLHDSVAHALNVISVRAGTARIRGDAEHALTTVAAIEDLSRETMADIDQVIGALRSRQATEQHVEVPPGLAALDPLVAQHRAGGHAVELAITGTPRPLAVPVEHGAYRIVQESLTNAARYGSGTTRVELVHDPDQIQVTVTNRVGDAEAARASEGGGHGLIGMRERAQALGGEIIVERVGEVFRVHARLPDDGGRR